MKDGINAKLINNAKNKLLSIPLIRPIMMIIIMQYLLLCNIDQLRKRTLNRTPNSTSLHHSLTHRYIRASFKVVRSTCHHMHHL